MKATVGPRASILWPFFAGSRVGSAFAVRRARRTSTRRGRFISNPTKDTWLVAGGPTIPHRLVPRSISSPRLLLDQDRRGKVETPGIVWVHQRERKGARMQRALRRRRLSWDLRRRSRGHRPERRPRAPGGMPLPNASRRLRLSFQVRCARWGKAKTQDPKGSSGSLSGIRYRVRIARVARSRE
jgi:hypothetical protein